MSALKNDRPHQEPNEFPFPHPLKPAELSLNVPHRPLSPSSASLRSIGGPHLPLTLMTPRTPGSIDEMSAVKCEIMVNWLHMQQQARKWITSDLTLEEGVVLRRSRGFCVCAPPTLVRSSFENGVRSLNVKVAMTINTVLIKILLKHNENASFIKVQAGLRLQVLPDYTYLPRCQKNQFAAFITDPGLLVVWEDQPDRIVSRIEKLEAAMVSMIWTNRGSMDDNWALAPEQNLTTDIEKVEETTNEDRRIVFMQPVMAALTLTLTILSIGLGWRQIAIEVAVDKTYLRIAFILAFLPQAWLSLFFCQCVVTVFAQLLGPIGQYKQNTKQYSGIPPNRINRRYGTLPHVTVQCPVYKEGLRAVIEPTVRSLKQAISTYEMQGGSANIFINDDGMQLISEEDADLRREFYDEHNIGWVARPPHNPNSDDGEKAFIRRGKFKKASNMNYALWVSQRIEGILATVHRSTDWSQEDELSEYNKARKAIMAEDVDRTWGDGNIRMGDYILLVDSDTRVPEDCLLDAVSEMEQSPQVAILQYSSGVMNVTDSFFEKSITFFTNLVYTAIRYAVANGDVAPFVGHNAILRWSAMQEISYDCPLDIREKYWSEETVSEDFDMALRLQMAGYISRFASYTGDGFQEGVSLTVYDELTRWEKYAYGVNELVFHPVHHWLTRGLFTKLFRTFIFSSMPAHSKVTIMAYIGTYYALGSSWILTILNYFVVGWFNGYYDHYYTDSWKIIVAILAVFTISGNLALAIFRYRVEEKPLLSAIWENFKWIPVFFLFFGGVSFHVSRALLSHMFGRDMSWGATNKEKENISFFEEVPRVMKRFQATFIGCFLMAATMVVLARFVPSLWKIESFISIFPLALVTFCHFFVPIVLNPNVMLFTW